MSGLKGLDKKWRDWVKVSILKGVPTNTIAMELFNRGWTQAAYELMSKKEGKIDRPHVDLSKNAIVLSDKELSISYVCYKPHIVVFDDFLSAEECATLIADSQNKFKVSEVVNDEDGSRVKSTNRISQDVSYSKSSNVVVKTIEARIAELLTWPANHGEGLLVLKYEDGGEYKPHYDYFNPDKEGSNQIMQKSGQRVGTFLMFLSEVEAGGSTCFPKLNLEIRPKVGRAVFFSNVDLTGQIDEMTLHAGMPVTQGIKYLATVWLREKPYS